MGVLHVVDRVFIALCQSDIDVEHEFGVGLARDQEETHGIATACQIAYFTFDYFAIRPFDQITQCDVGTARLEIFTSSPFFMTVTILCST